MSGDARAWAAAGREALRRGQPGKAVRAFDRALALEVDGRTQALRARAVAQTGDRSAALSALEGLGASKDPETLVDVALEFASLDQPSRTVQIAREVLRAHPGHRRALELVAAHAPRIGWTREGCAAMEALLARKDATVALQAHAARLYESLRDLPRALERAERAHQLDPRSVDAALVVARVAARAGDGETAGRAARRAAELAGHEPRLLREAAHALLAAGAPQEAARIFRRVLDLAPLEVESLAWLAELSLWRGDLEGAESMALEALERSDTSARAWSVRGAVCVSRGDYEGGFVHLDRALALAPDDVAAHHTRGVALRELSRYREAVEAIDLAILHASRYPVTAHASRLVTVMTERPSESRLMPDTYAELVHALVPLAGPLDEATRAGEPPAVLSFLQRALAEAGGNRTDSVTRLETGGLVGVDVRPNSRTACRYAQESLRTRELDEVLGSFNEILAHYGELPTIYCHRGEVFLWFGRYAEGEADFDKALALDRSTRWAWIGLAAARVLRGDLAAAGEAFDAALVHAPPPGRTLYVYRGELALLEGRLEDARADLEQALHINPERISAALLLALVDEAEGDLDGCARRVAEIETSAASLAASMAGEDREAAPALRARALLTMMRGNRSAGFVTYFAQEGDESIMRFVPPPEVVAIRH